MLYTLGVLQVQEEEEEGGDVRVGAVKKNFVQCGSKDIITGKNGVIAPKLEKKTFELNALHPQGIPGIVRFEKHELSLKIFFCTMVRCSSKNISLRERELMRKNPML